MNNDIPKKLTFNIYANNLTLLQEKLKEYTDNNQYVYKLCLDHYLVIMKKLDETKTNENRDNIIDVRFAKCRADQLMVCEIINVDDNFISVKSVVNKYREKTLEYVVGEIVKPDVFDDCLNNVCSGGVHYFRQLKVAYYYRIRPLKWTGVWEQWDENGKYVSGSIYKDGFIKSQWHGETPNGKKHWFRLATYPFELSKKAIQAIFGSQ